MDHFWVLNIKKKKIGLTPLIQASILLLITLFSSPINNQHLLAFGNFSAEEFHVIFVLLQLFPQ